MDLEGLAQGATKAIIEQVAFECQHLISDFEEYGQGHDPLLLTLLEIPEQVVHLVFLYQARVLRLLTQVVEDLLVTELDGILRRELVLILNKFVVFLRVDLTE